MSNPKTPTRLEFSTPSNLYRSSRTPATVTPISHRRTPRSRLDYSNSKTPGDRFIPSRSTTDMDFARFKISNRLGDENSPPNKNENKEMLNKLLGLQGVSTSSRAMGFTTPQANKATPRKNEYWCSVTPKRSTPGKKATTRKIPKNAERVLDAPNIVNDFYLNVLDWSSEGQLAVALGGTVYILNTGNGAITELFDKPPSETDYVSSLTWNKNGKYLAVASSNSEIQLWDVNVSKMVRQFTSHSSRVSTLAWNTERSILSSGSQRGLVHNYDPRMAQYLLQSIQSHSLDVCGLKWSPNGRFLASGGNDNIINVWDMYSKDPWSSPAHSLKEHTAAVKALSWSPWATSTLASGGGSTDKRICVWNACNGQLLDSVDTGSQVSGLIWSKHHRELLSAHGNPSNQLAVWSCDPSTSKLSQCSSLTGHEDRILHIALSDNGETVVSAGADETLRFWKVFAREGRTKKTSPNNHSGALALNKYIR